MPDPTHVTVKYDLKRPCLHCPFRNDDTGIRFHDEIRAIGIWLTAEHEGFPCHKTADYLERPEYDESAAEQKETSGYVFREGSQHCAGFLIMKLKEYDKIGAPPHPWPGIGNDPKVLETIKEHVDLSAPVFSDTTEFLNANAKRTASSIPKT